MLDKKTVHFGQIEEEASASRLYPYACVLLILVAWGRYFFRESIGFHGIESIVFSLLAISLLVLPTRPSVLSFVFGIAMWVFGVLAFGECATSVEGGNAFIPHAPWPQINFSPNGSIAVACLGLSLSLISKRRRRSFQTTLALILAAISIAVGGVALWGHLNGVVSAFSWGRFEPLSTSASILIFCSGALIFYRARIETQDLYKPSVRSTIVAIGIGGAVAATLGVAASMADIDNRRASVLAGEMTSLRRAIHVQQEVLLKALRKIGSALGQSSESVISLGSQEIIRELRYIRAFGKYSISKNELISYPKELDLDKQIVITLAEDLKSGGRTLESKVFKFRESWRIVVVLPEPKLDTYTFALLDVQELFMDVLSNIPDQMNVSITYLDDEIVSQGERIRNSTGRAVRDELQQLVFPFLGWPGWCVTISPAARFDETHALSGVFRAPLMLLITLSALGWAWGINERARRGKKLVDDIRDSAISLQLEHSRWAQALESVEGAIVLCDTNEKIEYYNAAAKVLFSAIADRKIAFISDVFSPESAALIRNSALAEARSGRSWQGNVFLSLKEKSARPLPLKVVAALNNKEGLIGYSFFFGANTPQSEVAHFHSNNPAHTTAIYSVLDGLEVPIWLASSDGNMEFGNRKLLDFLGCSQEHFRHAWPLEFCHRDDVTGFVAAGARLGTHRRRVQNSTGYMKWFSESITAVRTVEGNVGRYVGVLIECGKERRLEEVSRCLREEVTALMAARTSVMWIHDLTKRKVTAVSNGFDSLWGISTDELMLRANAWQELTQPPVELPDMIQDKGLELEYSIVRDDGASIPVTHTIIPTEWSDGVDSESHLIHIVERRGVTGRDTSMPSVRELKNELEHLYSFLAKNVHDAADQVGRLGRVLSQQAKQIGDTTISSEAMQLQFESERLLAWVSEYGEVAKVLNQEAVKPGVSIIEALESLSRNKAVIPQRVSFSGDLGVKLPIALESLEIAMRSLAIFTSDRGPKKVPIDIKVLVRKIEKGIGIEASLGELSMDKENLTRVFLPGGMNSEKGRVAPSLAPINALARKCNGRAWLSTNTSGRVTLHLQLNGEANGTFSSLS